jgi:propanol-preferring alcohol dehydrogenase
MLDLMSKHKIHVKTNAFCCIYSIPKLIEFAHSGKMAGKGVVIIDEELVAKEQKDTNG